MSAAGEVLRKWGTHPVTSDRIYEDDESEFLMAMQRYKEANRRLFPTWSEAFMVLLSLGYRKA